MFLKLVLVSLVLHFKGGVLGQYDGFSATPKTYDLEVPGSDPIRIIEAEPMWDRNPHDAIVATTERPWSGFEHRALRPIIKPTGLQIKTNINSPQPYREENENEETTPDSAEELTKFLKGYADQLRRTTDSPVDQDVLDYDSTEKFHKVELITTKPSDEPTNRLASVYLGEKDEDHLTMEDKSKNWNLFNIKKNKYTSSDDKNGWVSLEVVPWSVSKVAKWHSNKVKPIADDKSSINRYSNYNPNPVVSKPIWNQPNKPLINYRPGNTNYFAKPFSYTHVDNKPDYGSKYTHNKPNQANKFMNNKPNPRPGFPSPSTTYPQKVYLQPDYTDEIPRPPWNSNTQDSYDNSNSDPNCEHGQQDIITDGLPPNFPKPHQESTRRKGSFLDEDHPVSHPFNGDGEWVLLTTTKGFKALDTPNGRQRSLDIDSQLDPSDKESISTHKSVRLTVLPPLKDSKINMTTSHGGLLQVESTFETVDEAHKSSLQKQNMKKKPVKRRPLNRPIKQTVSTAAFLDAKPTSAVNTRRKSPNASSVLAAVGAGMIPATMAMLVPMMGKRRRRDIAFATRSPDTIAVEYQLQRSF